MRYHNAFTRMMHPYLSSNLVDRVNTAIDSPSNNAVILNHIMKKPRNRFIENYLTKPMVATSAPHRNVGHDYFTGLMLAAQYGPDAMQAFMDHMAGDMMRDVWVKQGGMYYADLLEAGMMYGFHHPRRRTHYPQQQPIPMSMPIPVSRQQRLRPSYSPYYYPPQYR